MGRRRKESDLWLPDKVYPGKSAYEYRPTKKVCIKVAPLDTPKHVVLRKYAEIYESYTLKNNTVGYLVEDYFKSTDFMELAPRTKKDYRGYWEKLKANFEHVTASKLLAQHIRRYLDMAGPKIGNTQANRRIAFLKRVYSWGYERGYVPSNPFIGVKRLKEVARDRYIEDHEYLAVYERASLQVKVAMEISYLCAARQSDVIALTRSQIDDRGIFIKQGKTGKKQIKAWTPRLLAAIELSKNIMTKNGSMYVIPTSSGTGYTSDGFRSMWDSARARAREETGLKLDFTFHDIKAKSISDYDGDKKGFSGHATEAQMQIYNRKVQIVEALNVPSISEAKNATD